MFGSCPFRNFIVANFLVPSPFSCLTTPMFVTLNPQFINPSRKFLAYGCSIYIGYQRLWPRNRWPVVSGIVCHGYGLNLTHILRLSCRFWQILKFSAITSFACGNHYFSALMRFLRKPKTGRFYFGSWFQWAHGSRVTRSEVDHLLVARRQRQKFQDDTQPSSLGGMASLKLCIISLKGQLAISGLIN